MKKTFKLMTISNIPIEINFSWFIILGLIIFTLAQGYFPLTNPELGYQLHWFMAIISALLLFSSLLAHELSHALVARKHNMPIKGVTLFIFGGVAHLEEEPPSPGIEFRMAIAGPVMSFFLASMFFVLYRLFNSINSPSALLAITQYLIILNMAVGIFNLIPGFPLDGGRILRALIWAITKNLRKATAIASGFGKGIALLLIIFGLYSIFQGALISGVWLIFIGLFLQEAAEVSYRQVVMKKLLSGIKVEALMSQNIITVPAEIRLDQLVEDYFFQHRHASFPVMREDNVLGIITLHDIKEVNKQDWSKKIAQEVMHPIRKDLVIKKDSDVFIALGKMAHSHVGRLLVIENHKLIGIISQRDIMKLFQFKSEVGNA